MIQNISYKPYSPNTNYQPKAVHFGQKNPLLTDAAIDAVDSMFSLPKGFANLKEDGQALAILQMVKTKMLTLLDNAPENTTVKDVADALRTAFKNRNI